MCFKVENVALNLSSRSFVGCRPLIGKTYFCSLQQAEKAKAAASGSKSRNQDDSSTEKVDPVRQAAIEALKRKRAAASGGSTAAPAPAPVAAPALAAPKTDPIKLEKPASQIKLKFVIPKKNLPSNSGAGASTKPAPIAKKPAAAPPAAKTAAAEVGNKTNITSPDGQPAVKRPAIRRTVPQRPSSQEEHPPLGQEDQAAPSPAPPTGPSIPSIPRLFVGDLPTHFTSETLFNFFSEFHDVEEAHVVSSFCYGFVTFGSYEDAQAVLDFQTQQPIQVEDRHLRISWARDTPHDTVRPREYGYTAAQGGAEGGAPQEHPRIKAARLAAAQVLAQQDQHDLEEVNYREAPGRNLVCYDDL